MANTQIKNIFNTFSHTAGSFNYNFCQCKCSYHGLASGRQASNNRSAKLTGC